MAWSCARRLMMSVSLATSCEIDHHLVIRNSSIREMEKPLINRAAQVVRFISSMHSILEVNLTTSEGGVKETISDIIIVLSMQCMQLTWRLVQKNTCKLSCSHPVRRATRETTKMSSRMTKSRRCHPLCEHFSQISVDASMKQLAKSLAACSNNK